MGPGAADLTATAATQVSFACRPQKSRFGGGFSCALLNDGSPRCWGDNTNGQISAADLDRVTNPTNPQPGMTFRDVAVGDDHTCALTDMSNMMC
ncbi:MAG: hypothetical protein R3E66_03070 [bacterium]